MIGRLIFTLLPYALVVACLAMLGVAATVIAKGAETAPTDVSIVGLTKTSPAADWLHVADGGLYLPGAVADTKTSKRSSTVTKTAYYVPLVSKSDALTHAIGVAPQGSPVYVKFSRAEFESKFPSIDETSDAPPFTPIDLKGTRSGSFSFSSKFKEYLRDDLKLESKNVTLIDFDNHPMQRSEAAMLSLVSIVVAAASVFWIKKRWQQPAAM